MKPNVAGVFLFVNTNENDLHLDLNKADLSQLFAISEALVQEKLFEHALVDSR